MIAGIAAETTIQKIVIGRIVCVGVARVIWVVGSHINPMNCFVLLPESSAFKLYILSTLIPRKKKEYCF